MTYWLALAAVGLVAGLAEAGSSRLTGRINSIAPIDGVVFVEDAGDARSDDLVSVQFRDAKVVRVWRDTERPTRWRERSTVLSRWPAGTFLVIIGYVDASGVVRAHRIEIPKPDLP